MIRVETLWLSVQTRDMRAGVHSLLAQVIEVFGQAQPHHAYLFANRRGTRMKVLVHDGYGLWLAQRQLQQGRFHWPTQWPTETLATAQTGACVTLTRAQFDALILGLPWQQLSDGGVIRTL
jgi:transposase